MRFVAEELRQIMAKLGFRSIDDMVGHSELIDSAEAVVLAAGEISLRSSHVDLEPFIHISDNADAMEFYFWNSGWGKAQNLQLKFNLISIADTPSYEEPFEFERKIGELDKDLN